MFEITQIHKEEIIKQVKEFDDLLFKNHQQISLHELEIIAQQNGLFAIFNQNSVIAEAQILFESTDFYTLENTNWAFIYGLGVAEEYRKKGLAIQMLSFIENLAKEKHKTAIYLATRNDNRNAISLWEKCGYTKYDYKPHFFGSDEAKDSRLLFKKTINLSSIKIQK